MVALRSRTLVQHHNNNCIFLIFFFSSWCFLARKNEYLLFYSKVIRVKESGCWLINHPVYKLRTSYVNETDDRWKINYAVNIHRVPQYSTTVLAYYINLKNFFSAVICRYHSVTRPMIYFSCDNTFVWHAYMFLSSFCIEELGYKVHQNKHWKFFKLLKICYWL